jgi:hypothetical protein
MFAAWNVTGAQAPGTALTNVFLAAFAVSALHMPSGVYSIFSLQDAGRSGIEGRRKGHAQMY